jgi:hypothetical protein
MTSYHCIRDRRTTKMTAELKIVYRFLYINISTRDRVYEDATDSALPLSFTFIHSSLIVR